MILYIVLVSILHSFHLILMINLDEHISPCCNIFSKKISSSLFSFFLVEKLSFLKV